MKKQILIIGLLTFLLLLITGCGNNTTGNFVADSGGYVSIPLSDLSNKAYFYTYDDNGVKINYFAVFG